MIVIPPPLCIHGPSIKLFLPLCAYVNISRDFGNIHIYEMYVHCVAPAVDPFFGNSFLLYLIGRKHL